MKVIIYFLAVLVLGIICSFVDNFCIRGVICLVAGTIHMCGIIVNWESLIVNEFGLIMYMLALVASFTVGHIYLFVYFWEKLKNK